MLCRYPINVKGIDVGCGQCLSCRINKSRLWTHRILLEAHAHEESSFVTLTYREQNLPRIPSVSGNLGVLQPKDTQNWLKLLREKISPHKIRYFLVGEYGEETQRPHYHAIIFGLGERSHPLFQDTWHHGGVYTGSLTPESALYVSGYCVKRMTNPNDPKVAEWLNGRHPEFARMSLKPGIGASAIPSLQATLETDAGCIALQAEGDVPRSLLHGKKRMPLGRYLRSKLRGRFGHEKVPDEVLQKISLSKSAEEAARFEELFRLRGYDAYKALSDEKKQKVKNFESRFRRKKHVL